jgi:hypothetical protein
VFRGMTHDADDNLDLSAIVHAGACRQHIPLVPFRSAPNWTRTFRSPSLAVEVCVMASDILRGIRDDLETIRARHEVAP